MVIVTLSHWHALLATLALLLVPVPLQASVYSAYRAYLRVRHGNDTAHQKGDRTIPLLGFRQVVPRSRIVGWLLVVPARFASDRRQDTEQSRVLLFVFILPLLNPTSTNNHYTTSLFFNLLKSLLSCLKCTPKILLCSQST